jgi:hypothetical protein
MAEENKSSKAGMPSNVPGADLGENKVDTIEALPKKNFWQQLGSDLNTAIQGNAGGMSGAAGAGGEPLQNTVQERQEVKQEMINQGIDPDNIVGYHAPVHADQVSEWKENPLEYNPTPTEEKRTAVQTSDTNEVVNPAGSTSGASDTGTSGTGVSNANQNAGAYNVGQGDVDSIAEGGKSEYDIAKEVLDENNPYKSGSDFLKYLWGQGGSGKAKAIGNVLGNLLSASGNAVKGEGDKGTQWNDFVTNYMQNENEARKTAMSDAQNAVKTANANKAARTELIKALNQAKAQGKNITEADLAAIDAWQKATNPSSALDKAIAAILAKIGNIPF